MIETATAPQRGKRSEATASIVGQKNVLPIAYTASAPSAPPKAAMPLTRFKPTQARLAHVNKMPTGDKPIFFSIKLAQNRRANMRAEVKINSHVAFAGVRIAPSIFCIQPSVPSSTAPTKAWVMNKTHNKGAPTVHRAVPLNQSQTAAPAATDA